MKKLMARRTCVAVAATAVLALLASCGSGGGGPSDDNGGDAATASPAATTSSPSKAGSDKSDAGDKDTTKPAGVPDPTSPVTITFESWVGNQKGMKTLYKKFRAKHPNITVKFQNVPSEQSGQKLTTEIAGGNPPDVAYIDASSVNEFATRKALLNLDDYLSRSTVVKADDFVPAFKQFTTYDDSMYGLPFDGESTGLFYRTDLFKAAGIKSPPKTWAQFEADAKKLTNPDKKQYGFQVFAPEAAYYWYPWLYQAGGKVISDDQSKVLIDSAAAKKAAQFYVDLAKYSSKDYLNANSYDGRVGFAQGQIAMYVAGAWFAGTMNDEYPKLKDKWAVAPLPKGSAGCATTIAGDALVILQKTKNADAAWKWIEFLTSKPSMAAWTYKTEGTLLPPRKDLASSKDLVKTKPVLSMFADQMKCGVTAQVTNPKLTEFGDHLNTELGKAIYGDETASQALDNVADEARQALSR